MSKNGIKAKIPIRKYSVVEKIEPLAALFTPFLNTLVKVTSRYDHLVSRKVAKKVTEIDVDARPI